MYEVELRPWHTHVSRRELWEGMLRDQLRRPGGEECLRASLEPELGSGFDLDGDALVSVALDLLHQGRLVMESNHRASVAVDPHYPTGSGSQDLGNLIDLLGDTPTNDEQPSPAEEPTWIEIAVVDVHGAPIGGRPYRLQLPDGGVCSGNLPDDGILRFDDIDPGLCTLELPTDDGDAEQWAPPPAVAA